MKLIISKIVQALDSTLSLNEDQKAVIEYALYNLLVTLSVVLGLAVVSQLFGLLSPAFIALFSGAVFRWSMGGAHYSKPWRCIMTSIAGPVAIAAFSLYASRISILANRSFLVSIILFIAVLACAVIRLYCPAETENNPLPDERKPRLRRISYITLILWLALMICLLRLDYLSPVIASCLSLARQLLSVTPVGYRTFLQIDKMLGFLESPSERRG